MNILTTSGRRVSAFVKFNHTLESESLSIGVVATKEQDLRNGATNCSTHVSRDSNKTRYDLSATGYSRSTRRERRL